MFRPPPSSLQATHPSPRTAPAAYSGHGALGLPLAFSCSPGWWVCFNYKRGERGNLPSSCKGGVLILPLSWPCQNPGTLALSPSLLLVRIPLTPKLLPLPTVEEQYLEATKDKSMSWDHSEHKAHSPHMQASMERRKPYSNISCYNSLWKNGFFGYEHIGGPTHNPHVPTPLADMHTAPCSLSVGDIQWPPHPDPHPFGGHAHGPKFPPY